MRGIANFGGPGKANAEMNRSDSIPSKGGMAGVTMGAKSGADAIMKPADEANKDVVQTAGQNVQPGGNLKVKDPFQAHETLDIA